ncbi:hypothetical protein FACS1894187_14000 [Synergistales bacterium]|nr:hypothetical protein FACS1894187_14000 [Synergistales bacterium]
MKMKRVMLLALVLSIFAASAAADVIYTTSDWSGAASVGTLGAIDENFNVKPNLLGNQTGDTLLFSFKDDGNERVIVVDKLFNLNGDRITVFDPKNWTVVKNGNQAWDGATNIYDMAVSSVAALNGKLYVAGNGTFSPTKAAGAVFAASTSDYKLSGEKYTPATGDHAAHGVRVTVLGEHVYALFSVAGDITGTYPDSTIPYSESKLVKLNSDLSPVAEYSAGKNASDMTPWNSGLAVAYYGGYQYAGPGTVGGIDFFHPATGLVTRLVDGESDLGGKMVLSVCGAGDALYFIGQDGYDSTTKLYRLTGSIGNVSVKELDDISSSTGYYYSVNYDAKNDTVVVLAGDSIVLYKNSGEKDMIASFDSAALGGGAYSVAILGGAANTDGNGGSGGGGCDVGGVSGLLALVIPAFLLATRKKSRV